MADTLRRAGPSEWQEEAPGSPAWEAALHELLAEEFPAIAGAIPDACPASLLRWGSDRRSQWVEVTGRFDAVGGRVALIGDAAHAMSPSIGEGCNCALESAAALDAALGPTGSAGGPGEAAGVSVEALTAAFRRYGEARPGVVREVQLRSASKCRPERAN
jgi:2-polyprenyl-6-methoxyphenol hydroxylase-like FAD-dependent oxidoreductase